MAFIGNQIITINSLLDLDGQELVLDADADSTIHVSTDVQIDFKIGGTDVATFTNSSSDFVITQAVQDKDIIFKGDDGGSAITALTLDMSEAGNASFNGTVTANAGVVVDNITIDGTEIDLSSGDLTVDVAGSIILDADGADYFFKNGGTEVFRLSGDATPANVTMRVMPSDGDLIFKGNDGGSSIEAARFDMSNGGSLLIGKTTQNNTAAGTVIQNDGFASFVRDGNFSLILNRLTNDGTIVDFRKDSSSVGTIGNSGGALFISAASTGGLKYTYLDGSSAVTQPCNTSGTVTDGTHDLGSSGARFRNLYLGGGLYVGGTGSANYLDDYEEGTFTPVLADATSGGNTASLGIEQGEYIKIGTLVFFAIVAANIDTSGMTGGNTLIVRGLPFAGKTRSSFSQHFVVRTDNINVGSACFGLVGVLPSAVSYFQFVENRDGAADNNFPVSGILSSTSDIFITGCYVSD